MESTLRVIALTTVIVNTNLRVINLHSLMKIQGVPKSYQAWYFMSEPARDFDYHLLCCISNSLSDLLGKFGWSRMLQVPDVSTSIAVTKIVSNNIVATPLMVSTE